MATVGAWERLAKQNFKTFSKSSITRSERHRVTLLTWYTMHPNPKFTSFLFLLTLAYTMYMRAFCIAVRIRFINYNIHPYVSVCSQPEIIGLARKYVGINRELQTVKLTAQSCYLLHICQYSETRI